MFSYQIFHGGVYNLAKKHNSNIAGRGPDFQDQPKLAVECVNQYLLPNRNWAQNFIKMDIGSWRVNLLQ